MIMEKKPLPSLAPSQIDVSFWKQPNCKKFVYPSKSLLACFYTVLRSLRLIIIILTIKKVTTFQFNPESPSSSAAQILDSCSTFQHTLSIRNVELIKITICLIMANLEDLGISKMERKVYIYIYIYTVYI